MAKKPIKKKSQPKVAPAEKKSKVDPKTTIDNTSGALIDCLTGDKKVTKLSPPTLFKIDVEDDIGEIKDPLTRLLQPFGNRDLSSTKITNTSSITDVDAKFSSIAFKLSSRIDMIDGGLTNLNKKFDGAIGQLNKKYEAEHKSSVQNYRKLEAQLSDIKQPTYGRGGLETKGGQKITGGGSRLPFSATDLAAMAILVYPHLKKNYLDPFFAKYDKEIGNLTNSIADNRAAVEAARKAARITSGAVTAGRTVAKGVGAAVQAVTPTPKTYGTPGTTTSFTGAPQPTPASTAKPKLKKVPLGAIINNKLTRSAFGMLLKKLPVIGLGAAMIDAGVRIGRGDRQGAALAAGSGLAGMLPGVGTVTSFVADLTLIAHDIFKEVHGRHPDLTDPEDIKEMGRIYEHIGKTRKSNEAYIKEQIAKYNTQATRHSDKKTFMAAMAKTGQIRRGQYTGMEMDEQVASTTKGGYLFGMIGGTKVPGKTITLDQNRQVPAYDINMGRMNLGAKGVPGTVAGSSDYMAQFAGSAGITTPSLPMQRRMGSAGITMSPLSMQRQMGSAGITTPPLPMQRQMAMMPPLPTMKPQPLSFASNSFRERVYQQKSQFMQFGALPGGFENVMGNRGILGKPVMVAASGAQPFGGGFGGGGRSGYSGGYSSGGSSGGDGGGGPSQPFTSQQKPSDFVPGRKNAVAKEAYADFGDGSVSVNQKGVVDKTQYYNAAVRRIASSELNGFVPKDGYRYGITTGAPEEWANLIMRTTYVESSFNTGTTNSKDEGGSFGLMQWGFHYGITKKNWRDPNAQLDAFVTATKQWVVNGGEYINPPKGVKGAKRYHGFGGLASMFSTFRNNKVNNETAVKVANQIAKGGAKRRTLDASKAAPTNQQKPTTSPNIPSLPVRKPTPEPKLTAAPKDMGPGYDDFELNAGTTTDPRFRALNNLAKQRAEVIPDDLSITKSAPGTPDTIADRSNLTGFINGRPVEERTIANDFEVLRKLREARDKKYRFTGDISKNISNWQWNREDWLKYNATVGQGGYRIGNATQSVRSVGSLLGSHPDKAMQSYRRDRKSYTPLAAGDIRAFTSHAMKEPARGRTNPKSKKYIRKYNKEQDSLAQGEERLFYRRGDYTGKVRQKLVNTLKAATRDLPEGYRVEMISGHDRRSTGTKNHPAGLAMDVKIVDANGKDVDHTGFDRRGFQLYEQLYRSAVIRGKEMYPDDKFIWGGAWISAAAGNGDRMHMQIVDPGVARSSQSSGAYDFSGRVTRPGHISNRVRMREAAREAYDASVRERMEREKLPATKPGEMPKFTGPKELEAQAQMNWLRAEEIRQRAAAPPPITAKKISVPTKANVERTIEDPSMAELDAAPAPKTQKEQLDAVADVEAGVEIESKQRTAVQAQKAKDDDSKNSRRTRSAGGKSGSGQHHPEQEAPRAGSSGYGASGRCWV